MTLEQARQNIGNRVTYIPYKGCDVSQYEYGVITSVNDSYVLLDMALTYIHKQLTPAI